MCTAKNQGGQRCFSSTSKALTKAHAKKVEAEVAYTAATDAGAPAAERETLLCKGLAAEYAYEDALSQYASTTKGHADLTERLSTSSPAYHQADLPNDPHRPDDVITVRTALMEGEHLRRRAAETKRAVKAGEMSPETALKRSEYPNEFARGMRAKSIDDTVARIKKGWTDAPMAEPAATSAGAVPPDHLPSLALDGWTIQHTY
jgi:hypothetical protein